jgi:hypothetical protein
MKLRALDFACPQCGSHDVIYSCKPECCFNHVCSHCYGTFEPSTTRVGEFQGEIGALPPDPDPSGPTAACARCGEITLFAVETDGVPAGQILCVSCRALLTLSLTELTAG